MLGSHTFFTATTILPHDGQTTKKQAEWNVHFEKEITRKRRERKGAATKWKEREKENANENVKREKKKLEQQIYNEK